MIRRPPRSTRTDTLFPYTTLFRSHLCCGSAGTYNILQPEIAGQLGDRKAANLARLDADVIATGNIGCAMQIGQRVSVPVVHIVELRSEEHTSELQSLMRISYAVFCLKKKTKKRNKQSKQTMQ